MRHLHLNTSTHLSRAGLRWSGVVLLFLAGAGVLYAFDPAESGSFPKCPFLSLTGCFCPGCGTLRALHQLLHGKVMMALSYNILTVALLPYLAYSFGIGALKGFGVPVPRPISIDYRLVWALLGVIVLFWVLRNLPLQQLSILAP